MTAAFFLRTTQAITEKRAARAHARAALFRLIRRLRAENWSARCGQFSAWKRPGPRFAGAKAEPGHGLRKQGLFESQIHNVISWNS